MMQKRYLYIKTIGCQMNVYDSERIEDLLSPLGYEATSSLARADLIIANTCAIRAKAEQKVFSFLGRLARLKESKPDLLIGMGGCVAQQEGAGALERVPHLDLVFGTHAIGRLPAMVEKARSGPGPVVDTDMTAGIGDFGRSAAREDESSVIRFVTIMQGCDNYCTYCVVPYVRGREESRTPERILEEIRGLARSGVREVTLLGQNVNSYGQKEGLCGFHHLLSLVDGVDGIWRIRFTTSHPKDLSEDLMLCFRDLEKLCRHIHLPVQSGSDRILSLMNRHYTKTLYLEKIDTLRRLCPDIAITSDVIVGFPGETPTDFAETLDLIKRVQYDSLYMFSYSDRPNAPAAGFPHRVSDREKAERFRELLVLQESIATRKNLDLVGSRQAVLVEGSSKKHSRLGEQTGSCATQWTGRTSANKVVNFVQDGNGPSKGDLTGKLVDVKIVEAFPHSLLGKVDHVRATSPV